MKRNYITPNVTVVETAIKGILMTSGGTTSQSVYTDDPQEIENALAPLLDF